VENNQNQSDAILTNVPAQARLLDNFNIDGDALVCQNK
jgi:hypothetical protein